MSCLLRHHPQKQCWPCRSRGVCRSAAECPFSTKKCWQSRAVWPKSESMSPSAQAFVCVMQISANRNCLDCSFPKRRDSLHCRNEGRVAAGSVKGRGVSRASLSQERLRERLREQLKSLLIILIKADDDMMHESCGTHGYFLFSIQALFFCGRKLNQKKPLQS